MKSSLEPQRERHPLAYEQARLCSDVSMALRSALEDSGLTQRALAEQLGVSPGIVSRQLAGAENLSLGKLASLAFALGLRCEISLCTLSARKGGSAADVLRRAAKAGRPHRGMLRRRKAKGPAARTQRSKT
jgi:transcriptional regulator with XRE-family HTH domain